jgi:hypothetical protein
MYTLKNTSIVFKRKQWSVAGPQRWEAEHIPRQIFRDRLLKKSGQAWPTIIRIEQLTIGGYAHARALIKVRIQVFNFF